MKPLVGFSNTPATEAGGAWAKKAQEVGAQIIRGSTEHYTMKEYAERCVSRSLKLTWISLHGEGFTAGNLKKTIEEYETLTAPQQAVFALVECCNEPYENPSGSQFVNGKAYGEHFIKVSEEWLAKGMTVPLGMVTRVSQSTGTGSEQARWMTELGECKRTGTKSLESALIGNGTKGTPQHRLISHPYGGHPLTKLKFRNSLSTTSAEESSKDANGIGNGAMRWLHEQAIVKGWTGLKVPTAITEFGQSSKPGGSISGSEKSKNEFVREIFEVAHKAWKNELESYAPEGYGEPLLYMCCWFQLQENSEGFGVYSEAAGNPEEPYFKTFKEAMASFTSGEMPQIKGLWASTSTFAANFNAGSSGKLIGSEGTYTVLEEERNGRMAAFQFTAEATGTLEELRFHTAAKANTGTEKLFLGVAAENAGKPGAILTQGKIEQIPLASNATFIVIPESHPLISSGTKYWLILLATGELNKHIFFNFAVASGGTPSFESTKVTYAKIEETAEWGAEKKQGPVFFAGLGPEKPSLSFSLKSAATTTFSASFVKAIPPIKAGPSEEEITSFAFRHLPVTSYQDVTHNFEQLVGYFAELERKISRSK